MFDFDEVYIVSDLHLGGITGHQIFRQGKKLGNWIDWVQGRPVDRIALVLNGDIFDFFSEPNASYFDPINSVDKISTIIKRFPKVFDALTNFVHESGRYRRGRSCRTCFTFNNQYETYMICRDKGGQVYS